VALTDKKKGIPGMDSLRCGSCDKNALQKRINFAKIQVLSEA